MTKNEALKILGLNSSATENEIKKRFKELAKKKHPDINKSKNAEKEYKQISEAFEFLKNNNHKDDFFSFTNSYTNFADIFGDIIGMNSGNFVNINQNNNQYKKYIPQQIVSQLHLTFEEYIKGCEKTIVINKYVYCQECNGSGSKITKNQCKKCNGNGFILSTEQKNSNVYVRYQRLCNNCHGVGSDLIECDVCPKDSIGFFKNTSQIKINIPPAINEPYVLRVRGAGNKISNKITEDVIVKVTFDKHPNIILAGRDLVSKINISLLDALKGCNKKVETLYGVKDLIIDKNTKNKDKYLLSNLGVKKIGAHIFEINIDYPKDTQKLIEFLEKKC